jgi:hypothetical protein
MAEIDGPRSTEHKAPCTERCVQSAVYRVRKSDRLIVRVAATAPGAGGVVDEGTKLPFKEQVSGVEPSSRVRTDPNFLSELPTGDWDRV